MADVKRWSGVPLTMVYTGSVPPGGGAIKDGMLYLAGERVGTVVGVEMYPAATTVTYIEDEPKR